MACFVQVLSFDEIPFVKCAVLLTIEQKQCQISTRGRASNPVKTIGHRTLQRLLQRQKHLTQDHPANPAAVQRQTVYLFLLLQHALVFVVELGLLATYADLVRQRREKVRKRVRLEGGVDAGARQRDAVVFAVGRAPAVARRVLGRATRRADRVHDVKH